MPHTLLISDLHLSADHKRSAALFLEFSVQIAPQAEALFILGDLFEYWAGDDDLDDPFHQTIVKALRELSEKGTPIYLMHGNRDFLMAEKLALACHATLLSDPTLLNLYDIPTLLTHGDALCTDDDAYQTFRSQVRDPDWQQQFLAQPLALRKAQIQQIREHSTQEKRHKPMSIMDVNDLTVAEFLREYHYPRLIHGHTHRPDRHEHNIDGHLCERWVLGDWDCVANALRCDHDGIRWESLPDFFLDRHHMS